MSALIMLEVNCRIALFIMVNNTHRIEKTSTFKKRLAWLGLGAAAILVVWQLLSLFISPLIIAAPFDTFKALGRLAADGSLWTQFAYTLLRLLIGLAAGSLMGVTLGILAGIYWRLRYFLEPLRWVTMTVPAIIVSVLVMLWFGLGSTQVVFMTALISLPLTYVSTLEGMMAIDERILEMSTVFKIRSKLRFSEIYLPGIGAAVMTGLTLAAGVGVRAAILAEFLGARNGIGHSLYLSWTFLDTPSLFAWIVTAFVLLALLEFGALRPARNYFMRWKGIQ
jgi:NitT/TauT family transport system permease protein